MQSIVTNVEGLGEESKPAYFIPQTPPHGAFKRSPEIRMINSPTV
jgi:hypothetical protein